MLEALQKFFAAILAFFMGLFGLGKAELPSYLNLQYGASSSQVLDMYLPDKAENIKEPLNVVVYIHGGGYNAVVGDKSNFTKDCKDKAAVGMLAVTINNRLLSEGMTYDMAMEDVTLALQFVKDKAASMGLSVNKVVLQGTSAGGHLALLYAYKNYASAPIPIAFCAGQVPRTNLMDMYYSPLLGDMWGRISQLVKLPAGELLNAGNLQDYAAYLEPYSPAFLVDENAPPTLLCFGVKDSFIPYTNGTLMVEKLEDAGVPYQFFSYPNSDHFLGNDPKVEKQFQDAFAQYVQTYMK